MALERPTLHVITAVSRPDFVERIRPAVQEMSEHIPIIWWRVSNDGDEYPTAVSDSGFSEIFLSVSGPQLDEDGLQCFGHVQRSAVLEYTKDDACGNDWVWILDDDNLPHPYFAMRLARLIRDNPEMRGFVFTQERGPGTYLKCAPENMDRCLVDSAQYVFRRDFIGDERTRPVNADDGGFAGRVYRKDPSKVMFVDEPLVYHNRLVWKED